MTRLVALVFLLTFSCPAFAIQDFSGKVVRVVDGDTVIVQNGREVMTIYLAEIDCPEKKQPHGAEAAEFVRDLIEGKTVFVDMKTKDRYGRFLADITTLEGKDLKWLLIREGHAWCYMTGNQELKRYEKKIRTSGKGLWAAPSPVPPWEYRKGGKKIAASQRISSPATRPAKPLYGDSAADIPRDLDGTAVGRGGGFTVIPSSPPSRTPMTTTGIGRVQRAGSDIMAKIKTRAKQEWPGDYRMQSYYITKQKSAYVQMQNYRDNGVPIHIMEGIKNKARAEWPKDYSMQFYVVKKQAAAYRSVR